MMFLVKYRMLKNYGAVVSVRSSLFYLSFSSYFSALINSLSTDTVMLVGS
jgi:hypothetical protein